MADGGERNSRRRLVDAAVQLILEHHQLPADPREVFAFLTPSAVAERAGLSRGLIYHYWGDDDSDGSVAFSRFLATVTQQLWDDLTVTEDQLEMAEQLPDDLSEVVAVLSEFELDRLTGPDNELSRAILALSLYGIARAEDVDLALQRLEQLYEACLTKLGREPVPPLTTRDIVFAVVCLLDGFTLNAPAMGGLVHSRHSWSGGTDRSLISIGVEALAMNMTRPVESTVSPARGHEPPPTG